MQRILAVILLALAVAPAANAAFPGRNGRIAFVRESGDRPPEIWVAEAGGARAHRLFANPPSGYADEPAWSPDGRLLAFSAMSMSSTAGSALAVIDAAGRGLHTVTQPGFGTGPPDWTQGGLVGYVHGGGTSCISTVGADGSGPADVLCKSGLFHNPRWSPDGTRLAYFTYSTLKTSGMTSADELWVRDLRGDTTTRLTPTPARHVDWSPDGGRLLYVASDLGLHVLAADGSGDRLIRTGVTGAAWSPDGKLILLAERPAKHQASLWTVRPDGSGGRRLTSGAVDSSPAWQPVR